jgi:cyanate permease
VGAGLFSHRTIPVPAAPVARVYQPIPPEYPPPPSMHWALVLLLGVVTCGIFLSVWFFVQASYIRKLVPKNQAMLWYGIGIGLSFCAGLVRAANHDDTGVAGLTGLMQLVGYGFIIAGIFSLKNGIEEHFNSAENIGLSLGGVMTFFFNVIYFQYHFNKICDARAQQGVLAARA